MIGLDTNVLVRYLTQDDPEQTRLANEVIDAMIATDQSCYIGQTVLVERKQRPRGKLVIPRDQ